MLKRGEEFAFHQWGNWEFLCSGTAPDTCTVCFKPRARDILEVSIAKWDLPLSTVEILPLQDGKWYRVECTLAADVGGNTKARCSFEIDPPNKPSYIYVLETGESVLAPGPGFVYGRCLGDHRDHCRAEAFQLAAASPVDVRGRIEGGLDVMMASAAARWRSTPEPDCAEVCADQPILCGELRAASYPEVAPLLDAVDGVAEGLRAGDEMMEKDELMRLLRQSEDPCGRGDLDMADGTLSNEGSPCELADPNRRLTVTLPSELSAAFELEDDTIDVRFDDPGLAPVLEFGVPVFEPASGPLRRIQVHGETFYVSSGDMCLQVGGT